MPYRAVLTHLLDAKTLNTNFLPLLACIGSPSRTRQQGSKPLNIVQHVEWIDHQREFNSINIKLDYSTCRKV
jgi:hypothetical protein